MEDRAAITSQKGIIIFRKCSWCIGKGKKKEREKEYERDIVS
jgi:hypothetical protein